MSAPAGSSMRPALDAPHHFMIATPTGTEEPRPYEGCRNSLVDPRDGTRLTLIRSADGEGDYEPVPLRYGLSGGELLRVECESGRPLGVVER